MTIKIRTVDRAEEKVCTKCFKLKPLSEFHRDSSRSDGRHLWCKSCLRASQRSYYQEHADERRAYGRRYHKTERGKAVNAAANRRHGRTEKGKATHKRYKQSEKGKATTERYEQSAKGKAMHIAVSSRRRARLEEADGNATALEIFMLLHNAEVCAYCGRASVELTVEHTAPLSRGGSHTLRNLTAVCRVCNSSKGSKLLSEWKNRWYQKGDQQ